MNPSSAPRLLKLTALAKQFMLKPKGLFTKHLFATNMAITVSFAFTGDAIEQYLERRGITIPEIYSPTWNVTRSLQLAAVALPFGITGHWTLAVLERYFKDNVFKKVALCQIFYLPTAIVMAFLLFGLLNRSTKEEIKENIVERGKILYIAGWVAGLPLTIVEFYYVPYRFRMLYGNLTALIGDVFFSFVMYRKLESKGSGDQS